MSFKELHEEAIRTFCERDGWRREGFPEVRRRLARLCERGREENPWSDPDLPEIFREFSRRPDAWRLKMEGPAQGWGHRVLVLEILEVEVTHRFAGSGAEMDYHSLWWTLDATERFHLRVFHSNPWGPIQCVLDGATDALAFIAHDTKYGWRAA